MGRRTAAYSLGSDIRRQGLRTQRILGISASGPAVYTEVTCVDREKRYETDPTPELSERFNDRRSGARRAAADEGRRARGGRTQRLGEGRGDRDGVDHGRGRCGR